MRRADLKVNVPTERPTTVYLNGEEIVTIQTSLDSLEELAVGFLASEGLLSGLDDLEKISVDRRDGMVWVETKSAKDIASKLVGKRFLTSGCGKGFSFSNPGDLQGLAPLESSFSITIDKLNDLMKAVLVESRRPGMHCSALADGDKLIAVRHDIGRHNTVDMLVGYLVLSGVDGEGLIMMTTGRISYEMAVKAAKAKIPVVASRSAATDLAIELAEKMNVEVAGYVRGKDAVVYTGLGRIVGG